MPGSAGDVALEPSSAQAWFACPPRGAWCVMALRRGVVGRAGQAPRVQLSSAGAARCSGPHPAVPLQSLTCSAAQQGKRSLPGSVGDVCGLVGSVVGEKRGGCSSAATLGCY